MHPQRVEARSERHDGQAEAPWSNLSDEDFLLAAEASLEALCEEEEEEEELSSDDIEALEH
ncbi:hypothetical protein SAMN02745121_08617 [Nannocystis exedens]|uniref:Uncharacterized protein n=1 Tax=Nannocystis exedens TaxID=54 RepID=A0A1I2IG51_9BACT|nr:hypothetical protein [Nannocystis exedens]PCC67158.1 hypothetical protein NAEX_00161 [Nannocystis exedens]SFF40047.1 hypothetical protein SAMN02745121_08617 [Nannocystis exedens]